MRRWSLVIMHKQGVAAQPTKRKEEGGACTASHRQSIAHCAANRHCLLGPAPAPAVHVGGPLS
jgi:hypothetical protein